MNSQSTKRESSSTESETISRRHVLRTAGAAALAGAFIPGAASAHDSKTETEVTFCGCSQVCACFEHRAWVIVATENNDGFEKRHVERSENFCYEVSDGEKIIALETNGEYWCNPNTCAEKAIAETGYECDNSDADTGQCGHPPCEHPGRGNGGRGNRGRNGGQGRRIGERSPGSVRIQ